MLKVRSFISFLCCVFLVAAFIFIPRAEARSFRVALLPEKARALKCSVCHIDPRGGGPRNPFGRDYERMALPAGEKITEALSSTDSDGDGVTNMAELEAGSNPGDKTSRP